MKVYGQKILTNNSKINWTLHWVQWGNYMYLNGMKFPTKKQPRIIPIQNETNTLLSMANTCKSMDVDETQNQKFNWPMFSFSLFFVQVWIKLQARLVLISLACFNKSWALDQIISLLEPPSRIMPKQMAKLSHS